MPGYFLHTNRLQLIEYLVTVKPFQKTVKLFFILSYHKTHPRFGTRGHLKKKNVMIIQSFNL